MPKMNPTVVAGPKKLSDEIAARVRSSWPEGHVSIKCFDAILAACAFLEKNKIDISIAQVGALTSTKGRREGCIKIQSIRNNPDFAGYVRARAAEQGLVRQRGDEATRSNFKTGDATTDSYIQTLEGELAQLRGQLKNLRSVIANQGEYDLTIALKSGKLMISQGHQDELPFPVVDAIRAILDPKLLRQVGLEIMPTGQIAAPDLSNAILLNKAQVEALKSVLLRHKHPDTTGAIKEK